MINPARTLAEYALVMENDHEEQSGRSAIGTLKSVMPKYMGLSTTMLALERVPQECVFQRTKHRRRHKRDDLRWEAAES